MNVKPTGEIPVNINSKYLTPESKKNTVGVLGSSKSSDEILSYMQACADITKGLLLNGKNILHGNGSKGIMGSANNSGKIYSKKGADGKPEQNLAIVTVPLWGDEDLDNCINIASAISEAERIEKFTQAADSFIVFPGSTTTLQEAATLISKNYYGKPEDKKQIILVGKDFYNGLQKQYQKLYDCHLINCPPDELFKVVDSIEEVNEEILNI